MHYSLFVITIDGSSIY